MARAATRASRCGRPHFCCLTRLATVGASGASAHIRDETRFPSLESMHVYKHTHITARADIHLSPRAGAQILVLPPVLPLPFVLSLLPLHSCHPLPPSSPPPSLPPASPGSAHRRGAGGGPAVRRLHVVQPAPPRPRLRRSVARAPEGGMRRGPGRDRAMGGGGQGDGAEQGAG